MILEVSVLLYSKIHVCHWRALPARAHIEKHYFLFQYEF